LSLADTLTQVLETADQLRKAGGAANEANTKVGVIEPVLAGLGWNLLDFNEVHREYKVYDGTFLDYAFSIENKPRLFLEAKALGKSLSDGKFIAQTVNYANNQGVVWCVLTNGLVYKVYKTNEPVEMERKLLLEVDIRDAQDAASREQVVDSLLALSRAGVQAGTLDAWAETVFIDMRTRGALAALGMSPPSAFVKAVGGAVDGPTIEPARLKASLGRVLGSLSAVTGGAVVGGAPKKTAQEPNDEAETVAQKKIYEITHHSKNKPSTVVDLFQRLDTYAIARGSDVERRVLKMYIGYFVGKKSFFTTNLQKAKLQVYLSLPPQEVQPWDDSELRDVTQIGKHGLGAVEFTLRSVGQLPRLEALIQQAYLRNRH
jgi:predicted transport protein